MSKCICSTSLAGSHQPSPATNLTHSEHHSWLLGVSTTTRSAFLPLVSAVSQTIICGRRKATYRIRTSATNFVKTPRRPRRRRRERRRRRQRESKRRKSASRRGASLRRDTKQDAKRDVVAEAIIQTSRSGLLISARSTTTDTTMENTSPYQHPLQQQSQDVVEESASTTSRDQISQHSGQETAATDMSPMTTTTAKEQSGPMEAQDTMGLDHLPDTVNMTEAQNLQPAISSTPLVRNPPPVTSPSMPLSSPTPTLSVQSHTKEAPPLQSLGLSQQMSGPSDSSLRSEETSSQQLMPPPSQLGNLHKRRAEASPEKFNTGEFQPLQPQALTSMKRIRTEDGTPRDVVVEPPAPQRTQLTAILSDFNLTPSIKQFPGNVGSQSTLTITNDTSNTPTSQTIASTQLTAGLSDFGFATPKAYTIPFSAIPPTPKNRPKQPFSLLNAFCANNELLLLLTSYLNIPSLISLYSISKVYHHQFNCHYTAHILAIMRTWAPHSEMIFPWRNYRDLCTKDPQQRQSSRLKNQGNKSNKEHSDLRYVPSFRWLQMVVYRHGVCIDMLIRLASYGHRCPAGTLDALKVRFVSFNYDYHEHTDTFLSAYGSSWTCQQPTNESSPSDPQLTSPTKPSCTSLTSSSKSTCTSRIHSAVCNSPTTQTPIASRLTSRAKDSLGHHYARPCWASVPSHLSGASCAVGRLIHAIQLLPWGNWTSSSCGSGTTMTQAGTSSLEPKQ